MEKILNIFLLSDVKIKNLNKLEQYIDFCINNNLNNINNQQAGTKKNKRKQNKTRKLKYKK